MSHRSIEQIEAVIGEKIRAYRLDRNLPQEVVASKAGISRGSLQRMEAGQSHKLELIAHLGKVALERGGLLVA